MGSSGDQPALKTVVFFGTPDFAVPSLLKLISAGDFRVLAVVTQPDARRGRGSQLVPSPVKQVAMQYNLLVYEPERLRKDESVLQSLHALRADFFVVVAYGQILPPRVLEMPRFGCVNVHGSLLPKYRGAAPIQWAIANGETVTGVTTMLMDAGIDTGAILKVASTQILPTDNAQTLGARLAEMGADLLVTTLRQFADLTPMPQDNQLASYAPLITKQDWQISWQTPAVISHNRVRGFYPNCFVNFRGDHLKILATEVVPSTGQVGEITALVKGKGIVVQTGDQGLLLTQVQLANRKPQTGWDFANGARLTLGQIFPSEEKSNS